MRIYFYLWITGSVNVFTDLFLIFYPMLLLSSLKSNALRRNVLPLEYIHIVLDMNTRNTQMEKRSCDLVLSVVTWEYEKMLMCQIKR
jgi:hypothetical protein